MQISGRRRGNTAGKPCLLSRNNNRADILVGVRRFFRDSSC